MTNGEGGAAAVDFRKARFTSSWREEALGRICELQALIDAWLARPELPAEEEKLLAGAKNELAHAGDAARRRTFSGGTLTGAAVQRVHVHLDAAEVLVLRAAPAEYVRGQTAALVAYVRSHLVPSDPRCLAAEQALRADRSAARPPDAQDKDPWSATRERLVAAVRDAMAEARNAQMRLRSFRNLLLLFAVVLFGVALGVGALGVAAPEKLPVCFQPVQVTAGQTATPRIVCPHNESVVPAGQDVDDAIAGTVDAWDVPMIELLGLIAAGVAATVAFRRVRGTHTPYSVPVTLALLKLPLGALTAVLGLILMRANFVSGLSALDNSAQIIGWAVVFGYAQQAFTQFVDRKSQDLLEDVGGAEQREKPPARGGMT
jgi:hypothetical protein